MATQCRSRGLRMTKDEVCEVRKFIEKLAFNEEEWKTIKRMFGDDKDWWNGQRFDEIVCNFSDEPRNEFWGMGYEFTVILIGKLHSLNLFIHGDKWNN